MKSVLLRAPVFSKSGYGVHSRQIYQYLREKNVDVRIQALSWGMTPWYVKPEDCNGLIGEMQEITGIEQGRRFDVTIQCQLPNEWDPSLGRYNIGITAGVEADRANPNWTMIHVNKMDKVIVPSEFSKKAFMKIGKPNTQIEVVPESYYEELNLDKTIDVTKDVTTSFNFLTVGVLTGKSPETDRKNLFYLLKWFVEEFKGNKDVGLIVKTNMGRDTTIDRVKTKRLLAQVLRELGVQGAPKVYLLHGEMSREEMNSLYKSEKVRAYITATRGEGFGLPILEAAVAGLPVVGTNWSAHTEFMNKGRWLDVKYDLVDVHADRVDGEIFVKDSRWAQVREKDFKHRIRNFYKKPAVPMEWAKNLSEVLKEQYSIESIKRHYDEKIGEVLD